MELRRACSAAAQQGNVLPALLGALLGAFITAALFGASASLQSASPPPPVASSCIRGQAQISQPDRRCSQATQHHRHCRHHLLPPAADRHSTPHSPCMQTVH